MTDEAKALVEWFDKTKWVQDSVQPHELGLHRADVLRNRIETQAREIERLRGALREVLDHARHADDCAIYHRTRRPCSCGFEVDDEAARAALAGEQ